MTAEFRLAAARPQQPIDRSPYQQWAMPDGTLWAGFYRRGDIFLLRFPDLADFEVSADGLDVCCWPAPDISECTIQHLYLNQVLPLALSKQGRLVFHGSAIAASSGVLAFMGESGRGKSTLAASFANSGLPFLTDDSLLLVASECGYAVQPSHPSIRLWDDSRQALVGKYAQRAPPVQYTQKARILSGDAMGFCPEARPLRRVYFLGEGKAENLSFQCLKPSEALIGLVKNTFLLDIDASKTLATHFDQLTKMVVLPIYYALDYPRRFGELPRVRQAILDHAMSEDVAP